MYTLKINNSNKNLFLNAQNNISTIHSKTPVLFLSVNDIAESYFKQKLSFDINVNKSDVIVGLFDSHKKIQNLSENQISEHNFKLFNIDSIYYYTITQKRAANLYLKSGKLELTDPNIEKLRIIEVDNSYLNYFNIGDTILTCSNQYSKIFSHCYYQLFDFVDTKKLFLNHNIDMINKSYIAVLEFQNNY